MPSEKMTLKPVNVGVENVEGVDFSKMNDSQLAVAEKIISEAEAQGLDPELALSLAHIESKFNPAAKSPRGALGPMQLLPGTAKDMGIDPNDLDQNIKGGISYYKQQLDKYGDPYVAGIAYNAGPGVADKFLETDDLSVIPSETLNYIDQLGTIYKPKELTAPTEEAPTVEKPAETPEEQPDMTGEKAVATLAGAGLGKAAGNITDTAVKQAEKVQARQEVAKTKAAENIGRAEQRVEVKKNEFGGRLQNQQNMASQLQNEVSVAEKAAENARKNLQKAEETARKFGVLEEVVKTTPGGTTQAGGLGSGAMRHSNTMGEVHEANVVRKGTESAGPGWSQKSRIIVPDKYSGASVFTKEQLAAKDAYAKAMAEAERAEKALDKTATRYMREKERLQNLTVKGPSGMTAAEANLDQAKRNLSNLQKIKTSAVTKAGQFLSKIPGSNIIPGAALGLDVADTAERYKKGDYPGAAVSAVGTIGGAMSMLPPVGPIGSLLKIGGTGLSTAAPFVNMYLDKMRGKPTLVDETKGALQDTRDAIGYGKGGVVKKAVEKVFPTVRKRERVEFPKIYRDPREIVEESALQVPEESPYLKKLFNVTREDLDLMTRDLPADLAAKYYIAQRPPEYVKNVMGSKNTQRIQDILDVASKDPRFAGSYGWYFSEPLKKRFTELLPEGEKVFDRFTQIGSGLSPSTDVPKEIQRSSVAYMMDRNNRLSDFLDPKNLPKGYGHAYHTTAHNAAIRNMLEKGDFRPSDIKAAPKTRVYYESRTGENLDVPTADAHFVRGIGLADVRPGTASGDYGKSISVTELDPIANWYRDTVTPLEMRASPAQALQWNAMGSSTGVETELGVPFMELLARRVGTLAEKENTAPNKILDDFILGKRHLAKGGLVNYAQGGRTSADIVGEIYESQPRAIKEAGKEMYQDPGFFSALDMVDAPLTAVAEKMGDVTLDATNSPLAATGAYMIPYAATMVSPSSLLKGGERVLSKVAPGALNKIKNFSNAPYAAMEATSPGMLQDVYRLRDTGEMANDAYGLGLSDERARMAIERAGMDKYNIKKGQGAWGGGGESEFNRAYVAKMPRTTGPLSKYDKQLAQFGSDTDQMMMSNVRFFPQDKLEKSTAFEVKGLTEDQIVKLNKKLGGDFVIQHRPQTKSAVIFNWTDDPKLTGAMENLHRDIASVAPKAKITPGTFDSSVIMESEYGDLGAKVKSPNQRRLDKQIKARK